jgi:HK97 family phage prohead protease
MSGGKVELREASDGKIVLETYASTFNQWYPIGAGIEERILPGAFARSIAEGAQVSLRLEHDNLPLASTKSTPPTLTLSEGDGSGLLAVANLNPLDPDTRMLKAKAENSPLEASFAFRCDADSWDPDFTKRSVRIANLHKGDVSIVAYGANPYTSVAIAERAMAGTLEERRAFAERVGGIIIGPRHGFVIPGEQRADAGKYTDADVERLGHEGNAHPRASGGFHFPIDSIKDLHDAILAIGRAPESERASIRRFIMKRAAELNASYLVPSAWHHDGASSSGRAYVDLGAASRELQELRQQATSRAAEDDTADLETCPLCEGSGKIREGNRQCPDCEGTGKVAKGTRSRSRGALRPYELRALERERRLEAAQLRRRKQARRQAAGLG